MSSLSNLIPPKSLIAILRGVTPKSVLAVADRLISKGFYCIEVPLNSPEALKSIKLLSKELGDKAIIAAGTVVDPNSISEIKEAGGKFILSPHCDPTLIKKAFSLEMPCIPGFSTPTEAYQAIQAGAKGIKFFPATALGSSVLKSILAILPSGIGVFPTGGITPENFSEFASLNVSGFGLGGELYKPEYSLEEIETRAQAFVSAAKKNN